jgi:hypothetical protein
LAGGGGSLRRDRVPAWNPSGAMVIYQLSVRFEVHTALNMKIILGCDPV